MLVAKMRTVTPVFCGGARPNEDKIAEIRPLSIRGALRWWYRALDAGFREGESRFFGSTTGTGSSSPISVRVSPWLAAARSYEAQFRPQLAPHNGAAYLGYTLYLGGNDRRAVPEDRRFELRLAWQWVPRKREEMEAIRRCWAACLWLFGHLGGLGTRARRGLGTIALEAWEGWPECAQLPPAHSAATVEEWTSRFEDGFRRIRKWFPASTSTSFRHHFLPAEFVVTLSGRRPSAVPNLVVHRSSHPDWYECLKFAGERFRDFRSRPHVHSPQKLAAFGLPLRFRSGDLWQPGTWHRAASRLHFRVLRIRDRFHVLAWRSAGPLAADNPITLTTPKGATASYDPANDRLLGEFLADLASR